MARISVTRAGRSYRVSLKGRLLAVDLKHLERACRHALEHRFLPLELNLERVTEIDETARAYIERLRMRGARVRHV
jgi:hypothetical protein